MGSHAGLEVIFSERFWWERRFSGRLLSRRGHGCDGRNAQVMGRLAGAAEENDRAFLCHSLHRDTERMHGPALLKKGSATDDLRHNSLAKQ